MQPSNRMLLQHLSRSCNLLRTQLPALSRCFSSLPADALAESSVAGGLGISAEQLEMQSLAREFAVEKLMPQASKWDEHKIFPVDVMREAAQLGFAGVCSQRLHAYQAGRCCHMLWCCHCRCLWQSASVPRLLNILNEYAASVCQCACSPHRSVCP